VPVEALHDGAARERPNRDAEPADAAPDAQRRAARCGGVASDSRVSVSGKTIAAPAPCTARAAMSMPVSGDRAAAALAAVKTASPMTNIRRRPKRSPSAAPVSSSTANVSV